MQQMKHTQSQAGLSLIELMIAMTIGLLIMAGLANLFIQSKQSFRQDNLVARMQEDARFAMNQLSSDVGMAGFFGPMEAVSIVNEGTVPATAPFDTYDSALYALDNVPSAVALDWTAALDDVVPGTDAVSIRRVEGDTTAVGDLENGIYYLETNGQSGNIIAGSEGASGMSNATYWEYVPSIWYIRSWCRSGDGVPSLVRRYRDSTGVVTDCMAAGIEDLQLEFGLDTNGDLVAESYQSADITAANAQQLAAVRIHLLSRSVDPDRQYTNSRTYNIANATAYTPADSFYRRVYTTTVQTRNPTGYRAMTFNPAANN